jgi:hypothetical protein
VSLLFGCHLDTSGSGHASGLGSGGGETTGAPTGDSSETGASATTGGSAGATSSEASTAVDATEDGSEPASSSSDGGDDEGSSTTAPVDPCSLDPAFMVTIEADAATLGGTMMLGMLGNGDHYLYSTTADTGSASFTFHTDCADEYAIWGDVYDANPLFLDFLDEGNGADRMRVDLGASVTDWNYKCQTGAEQWSWQSVSTNNAICSNDALVVYSLVAGEQTVVFTPTEGGETNGGSPGNAAGLRRIIITNDLDFVP